MKFPDIEVLSNEEVNDIHSASLKILEEIGFKSDCQELIEMMKGSCTIDKEGVIHVPYKLAEKAIGSVQSTIRLYNPAGSSYKTIGRGNNIFLSGHQAVFVLDCGSPGPRPGTKQDVVNFTRLANAVNDVDGIAVPVYPQDVPEHSALIHALESMLTYSNKPLFFAPEDKDSFETICSLARAASGNDNLGKRPFLLVQPSPISPLFWARGPAQCIMGAAREGIPCISLTQITPGLSGPVTLAGSLALHHAEALIGLIVLQSVNPGTPAIYPGAWVTFDMAGGGIDIGAPEKYLLSIASSQLARYIGIPNMTAGPDTNSHLLDIQNGIEKSLSAAADILSGTDVVVNTGMFSNALTVSLEQIIIDAEIISILKRVRRGIEVDESTIAFEAIKRVGIKGVFLTDPHTLDHFRGELWDTGGALFQRDKFDKWSASGSPEISELAHNRVKKILSEKPGPVPGKDQIEDMKKIVTEFDRVHGYNR